MAHCFDNNTSNGVFRSENGDTVATRISNGEQLPLVLFWKSSSSVTGAVSVRSSLRRQNQDMRGLEEIISCLLVTLLSVIFAFPSGHSLLHRFVLPEEISSTHGAVCNDHSPAHYYVSTPERATRRGAGATRKTWVVYVEGGGGCREAEACRERYDTTSRRLMASQNDSDIERGGRIRWTFPNLTRGLGLLASDPDENPTFYSARKALLPYCSSDLWLGRSRFDAASSKDIQQRLRQKPENVSADDFAYRGVCIFRTIFRQLWHEHGLRHAKRIVLAGSSAGAVGILNHASWVQHFIERKTCGRRRPRLALIADSAWFIDFREVFSGEDWNAWVRKIMRFDAEHDHQENHDHFEEGNKRPIITGGERTSRLQVTLTNRTESRARHRPCRTWWEKTKVVNGGAENFCQDVRSGFPCCMSAPCIFRHWWAKSRASDAPVLALVSEYDMYVPTLAADALDFDASYTSRTKKLFDAVRLLAEYGGAMKTDIRDTSFQAGSWLSRFTLSCLQHVYLATSDMWSEEGVLGEILGDVHKRGTGGRAMR